MFSRTYCTIHTLHCAVGRKCTIVLENLEKRFWNWKNGCFQGFGSYEGYHFSSQNKSQDRNKWKKKIALGKVCPFQR